MSCDANSMTCHSQVRRGGPGYRPPRSSPAPPDSTARTFTFGAAAQDANVFIPFDAGYRHTVQVEPACTESEADSNYLQCDNRIYHLIEVCRFGIHDISRIEHNAINNLPRFNMPFELGLFLGARRFRSTSRRAKQCQVLEADRDRYQKNPL